MKYVIAAILIKFFFRWKMNAASYKSMNLGITLSVGFSNPCKLESGDSVLQAIGFYNEPASHY